MLMGLPNRGTLGAHLVAIEKHRASGNMLDIRGNAERTYKYLQPLKVSYTSIKVTYTSIFLILTKYISYMYIDFKDDSTEINIFHTVQ